jgi:hypothetical protein
MAIYGIVNREPFLLQNYEVFHHLLIPIISYRPLLVGLSHLLFYCLYIVCGLILLFLWKNLVTDDLENLPLYPQSARAFSKLCCCPLTGPISSSKILFYHFTMVFLFFLVCSAFLKFFYLNFGHDR